MGKVAQLASSDESSQVLAVGVDGGFKYLSLGDMSFGGE